MKTCDIAAEVRSALEDGSADRMKSTLEMILFSFEQPVDCNVFGSVKKQDKERMQIQRARLAEMGSMLNTIIHQWKQPISVMNIIADLMEADLGDGKYGKEDMLPHVLNIKQSLSFLCCTVEDFRNFFKPDRDLKQFSMRSLIDEVLRIMDYQILKCRAEVIVSGCEDVMIKGYPNEVKHVLLNLISNSLDAFADNNEKNERGPKICLRLDETSYEAVLTVSDNCGGIPEYIMQHLFEPYVTTKGEDGTGIGLALAKTIVEERHSGRITAVNGDGGAVFNVHLPKSFAC